MGYLGNLEDKGKKVEVCFTNRETFFGLTYSSSSRVVGPLTCDPVLISFLSFSRKILPTSTTFELGISLLLPWPSRITFLLYFPVLLLSRLVHHDRTQRRHLAHVWVKNPGDLLKTVVTQPSFSIYHTLTTTKELQIPFTNYKIIILVWCLPYTQSPPASSVSDVYRSTPTTSIHKR